MLYYKISTKRIHYLLCYQTTITRFMILIMKLPSYNPTRRAGDTQILGLNVIISQRHYVVNVTCTCVNTSTSQHRVKILSPNDKLSGFV